MSFIRHDMKSSKMIVWSRWDHLPSIFKELDQGRRREIFGLDSGNIGEVVVNDFFHISVLT